MDNSLNISLHASGILSTLVPVPVPVELPVDMPVPVPVDMELKKKMNTVADKNLQPLQLLLRFHKDLDANITPERFSLFLVLMATSSQNQVRCLSNHARVMPSW